jgi:hypothetical protein
MPTNPAGKFGVAVAAAVVSVTTEDPGETNAVDILEARNVMIVAAIRVTIADLRAIIVAVTLVIREGNLGTIVDRGVMTVGEILAVIAETIEDPDEMIVADIPAARGVMIAVVTHAVIVETIEAPAETTEARGVMIVADIPEAHGVTIAAATRAVVAVTIEAPAETTEAHGVTIVVVTPVAHDATTVDQGERVEVALPIVSE